MFRGRHEGLHPWFSCHQRGQRWVDGGFTGHQVPSWCRVAWLLRLAPILPGLVYSRLPGRYCAGAEPHKSVSMGRDLPNTPFQRRGPRQKFKGKEKLYGSLKEGYREAMPVDHAEPTSRSLWNGMSPSFQHIGPLSLKPDSAHVFRAAYGGADAEERRHGGGG